MSLIISTNWPDKRNLIAFHNLVIILRACILQISSTIILNFVCPTYPHGRSNDNINKTNYNPVHYYVIFFAFLSEKLYHSYQAICGLFPTFYFHVYENQKRTQNENISAGAASYLMLILPACRHAAYFTATTLKNGVHSYIASFGEDPFVIYENLNHIRGRLSSKWRGSDNPKPRRLLKFTTHSLPYYYVRGAD